MNILAFRIKIPVAMLLIVWGLTVQAQTTKIVDQWGLTDRGKGWPILNTAETPAGEASMGSDGPPSTWATIRGSFGRIFEATTDSAVVIRGQFEYVGDGPGTSYIPLRYALTFKEDEGILMYQYTDSAAWSVTGGHYGYELTPRSGSTDMANGAGGAGTIWTINNGNWNSTWSNNGAPIAATLQAPRNAEIVVGVYNFAISIQPIGDGTNEVRWYMFHEDKSSYWFGSTAIDTAQVSTQFNGICFGIGGDITTKMTRFNVTGVTVELGEPLSDIIICPNGLYIDTWGIIGGRFGGWTLTEGDLIGNVSVAGENPNTDWTAIRGAFPSLISLREEEVLKVHGTIEFIGGGFQAENSLRLGLFNSDSAGVVIRDPSLDSALVWTGSENYHSGYLFVPPSGNNEMMDWQSTSHRGTWGAVVDGIWLNPQSVENYVLGGDIQFPPYEEAGEGRYDFAFSLQLIDENTTEIRFSLIKEDSSFIWFGTAMDNHIPLATEKINCIALALSPNPYTTAMNLYDVELDMGDPIEIPTSIDDHIDKNIPSAYSLYQNFPNPFNPVTFIHYSVPYTGYISLKVYNSLGQEVATLFEGLRQPGNYVSAFSGDGLASGIYFYTMITDAGFTDTKKLVLIR